MNCQDFLALHAKKTSDIRHLVIFSGGQDSTTILLDLISKYGNKNIIAMTIDYGQTHPIELQVSRKICADFQIDQHIVNLDFYKQITDTIKVNTGLDKEYKGVTNRNLMFMSIAWILAEKLGCNKIYLGASEVDFSGYPDCRIGAIKAQEHALQRGSDNWDISFEVPLINMSKVDEWRLVDELGMMDYIFHNTHTCYNNVDTTGGCEECPACVLRNDSHEKYLKLKEK